MLPFRSHKQRFQHEVEFRVGFQIVTWLIKNGKDQKRIQAPRMFLAPAQRFPVIAEYFDFELIAFRTRDRDHVFAIVRSDRHFKTNRSVHRSIVDRISSNEVPTLTSSELKAALR